jgi:hypothetical protein
MQSKKSAHLQANPGVAPSLFNSRSFDARSVSIGLDVQDAQEIGARRRSFALFQ